MLHRGQFLDLEWVFAKETIDYVENEETVLYLTD